MAIVLCEKKTLLLDNRIGIRETINPGRYIKTVCKLWKAICKKCVGYVHDKEMPILM